MKSSPIARGVRTFLVAVAGFAAAWAAIDWQAAWKVGLVLVGLNLLTAGVAGVAAALLARAGVVASGALGKAIAQFCQIVGSGVGVLVFSSVADIAANGRVIVSTVVAALFAAVGTLALNAAEDTEPVAQ